ncbi:hypothetical protein BWI93_20930 [Siphonobacter sp. BAB-5385]|uniref:PA2169 family four-helix-bundle protein n=1 Tax=Siphonobacter sp. BAB-5385 TaxID=1864822 RepID=UPI000B9E89E2|nr:PA2169 family four-helix-bundle protein [Siphonobacter sp. BAB-5385]OZI06279.1 hypothetical protein BWI93_20930 [Siphonobacter sp. BAB-5385]
MDVSEQRQILNFLYAVCSDRHEQYQNAREEANESHLKEMFGNGERESRKMMEEIRTLLQELNLEWEEQSTLSGDLHNLWIDFRSKLSGHDSKAILDALCCAEEANLEKYQQEWQNNQSGEDRVQALISHHRDELKHSLEKLKTLTQDEASHLKLKL